VSRIPFEILEHTADIGLKAYGSTIEALFINAAAGLQALALPQTDRDDDEDTSEPDAGQAQTLRANGGNYEDLLVGWLSEILYFIDAEEWSFAEFRIIRIAAEAGEFSMEGRGIGSRRDPSSRSRAVPVKAVTYHQISVRQIADGWEAVVYFDI
jgi:SHS2 domain-containing protein